VAPELPAVWHSKMKTTMKKLFLVLLTLIAASGVSAQKERKFVREGNGYYSYGLKDTTKLDTISFGKAEVAYRRALELKPEDFHWQFNLANSIYKQNKPDQAANEFEKLAEKTTQPAEKSMVYHNFGNSLLAQKKFDPSIDAYKKALRITPNDPETKYNLAYAMKMKKKDQEQKQKDKDKQKDNQDQKNQNKDQDKDKQDQNKNQQNKNQQQQQQPQNKISKQSAEQMLQALENDEKQTQEKVRKAQALRTERMKVEKNW
jgi:Ca-activated chloride channel family protein